MLRDISVISYGAAAVLFAVLSVLIATRYLRYHHSGHSGTHPDSHSRRK